MSMPIACCPTTTKRRPPVRAKKRSPAPRRRLTALEGIACILEQWHCPQLTGAVPDGTPIAFASDAFDRQLSKPAARQGIVLNMLHDGLELVNTRCPHLAIWKCEDAIFIRLEAQSPATRRALSFIREFGYRGLSVGCKVLNFDATESGLLIRRARIVEVSICERPANPGCGFSLFFRKER
jgi:hypothetical protein